MSYTILLTGFEPFGDWEVNPTAITARQLDKRQVESSKIIGRVIPLRYKKILPEFNNLVQQYQPDAIILSGQAGGSTIRLERNAFNNVSATTPYNCGAMPDNEILVDAGPDQLHTTLPIERYYKELQLNNIPISYSDSAGRFGCNQIFYYGRYYHSSIPSGFIHVPLLPEQVKKDNPSMTQNTITKALWLICNQTVQFLTSSS